jgi:hypothetical protein
MNPNFSLKFINIVILKKSDHIYHRLNLFTKKKIRKHKNKKINLKILTLTYKHTHKDLKQNRCFIALDSTNTQT